MMMIKCSRPTNLLFLVVVVVGALLASTGLTNAKSLDTDAAARTSSSSTAFRPRQQVLAESSASSSSPRVVTTRSWMQQQQQQQQQQHNQRQELEKLLHVHYVLRGGGSAAASGGGSLLFTDPASTAKVAIYLVLLHGLLMNVAPHVINKYEYGIVASTTPLNNAIMESTGTSALSFGLAAYSIVLQEMSLSTAIQISCIPWIYMSLRRYLNYYYDPQQSQSQRPQTLNRDLTLRNAHLFILLEMLLICHAVTKVQLQEQHFHYHYPKTRAAAAAAAARETWFYHAALYGHCAFWFLQGLALVLNPVGTTRFLWNPVETTARFLSSWGLQRIRNNNDKTTNNDKEGDDNNSSSSTSSMIVLPGVARYMQRNFGFSLLAWSTFISAMIIWNVDARTALGFGWIFWALLHFTGTLLTRDCTRYGIPQGPQYLWLLFHIAVVATILF